MSQATARVPAYRDLPPEGVVTLQLQALDRMWTRAVSLPFYAMLQKRHALPARISRITDLQDFPVLTKEMLQEHADLVWQGQEPSRYYVTGGSTGTPTRFPKGPGELQNSVGAVGCYRQHWGVLPFDRYLYVGGSAHLLTSGRLAWARRAGRSVRDVLVNGGRIDGWSSRPEELDQSLAAMGRHRPEVVVGFPSKLLRLAERLDEVGGHIEGLRLIILSSENVSPLEVSRIEGAFGAKVILEYGSEEVGLIAASWDDTWPMRVMFDTVLVRAPQDDRALVTTLADRAFPLVNYSLGDHVTVAEELSGSVLSLAEVRGREREQLSIPLAGGRTATSMPLALVVVLKQRPGVVAAQFHQPDPHRLDVYVQLSGDRTVSEVRDDFACGLATLHPDVDTANIRVGETTQPDLTSRQKLRVVLPAPPAGATGPLLPLEIGTTP